MMATTSLWHIEGRLKDLIAYVENPEKTVANNTSLQPLWEVMSYVSRPEATEQGEYVSTINCLKEIALQQMILPKKQYGKENGYIAWHGYQSFKPDEVTAKEAHEIGMQTAKIESDMNRLIEVRTKLQNKIRRATPAEKETLREEKAGVTARIMELRKQLKMNRAIEERSVKIQEKTDMFFANEIVAQKVKEQKIRERQKGGWER